MNSTVTIPSKEQYREWLQQYDIPTHAREYFTDSRHELLPSGDWGSDEHPGNNQVLIFAYNQLLLQSYCFDPLWKHLSDENVSAENKSQIFRDFLEGLFNQNNWFAYNNTEVNVKLGSWRKDGGYEFNSSTVIEYQLLLPSGEVSKHWVRQDEHNHASVLATYFVPKKLAGAAASP